MRVPLSWLREYVRVDVSPEELGRRLSLTGTKLETIHHRGVTAGVDADGLFRVGRVLAYEQHPNADRLRLVRVDVGDEAPRQIVCGASNFGEGDTVAVALPGAVLPDGTRLRRARLRGVDSDGMMLSERELDLGTDHAGIMTLPGGPPAGAPLADHLPLAETVLEFEITPNRPDCLAVYGIAREVSAVEDVDLAPWPGTDPAPSGDDSVDDWVTVTVEDADLCPRWAGRVFTDVEVGASPAWLRARLLAAGMRPISNVVDITNYVMLAVGEPTHAFDLEKVEGRRIVVRRATDGEPVVTLDGRERTLDRDVLVIADAEKPSAVAGLMGSEWSEVTAGTTTVLLECANFDGPNIHASSQRLGLRTEGSARWEKGVDPHLVPRALALASQLMVDLCGARLVPGTADVCAALPEQPVVPLRRERLERVIGAGYTEDEVDRILRRLGYEPVDAGWRVPTWRAADTPREVDLIEEVSRVAGLERLPALLPPHSEAVGRLSRDQVLVRRVVDTLIGAGISEAVTIPFADEESLARLRLSPDDPRMRPVRLVNPLGADQGLLRTTLLPALLGAAARNLAVGAPSASLFEIAHVYREAGETLPDEPTVLAAVVAGERAGYFRLKGVLEAVHAALGLELAVSAGAEPFLHPGRAARIAGGGYLGEVHPRVAAAFGVEAPAAAFELDLGRLIATAPGPAVYRDVVAYPPVRQDIAVVVPDDVPAGDVVAAVREAGGPVLASARVFDVYRGAQVGEGRTSLALHLVFQAPDRTLTEEEASTIRERIVAALGERFGGELRR